MVGGKVIVNADDFGINDQVTDAIVESFRMKYINRTTLMVNMPGADRAVRLARAKGFCDRVGLHFNITEGIPLTEQMRRSIFCAEDGSYNRFSRVSRMTCFSRADRDALMGEVRAQIERFLSYGLFLRHFDSHHHVHFHMSILALILPILSAYGFETIRRPYNVELGWGPVAMLRRLRNHVFEKRCRETGLRMSRYFCALKGSPALNDVEYMVHPRYSMASSAELIDCSDYLLGKGLPLVQVRRVYDGSQV